MSDQLPRSTIIDALSHYFVPAANSATTSPIKDLVDQSLVDVQPCSGGVNNFVFYCDLQVHSDLTLTPQPWTPRPIVDPDTTPGVDRYILRIYNNGNDEDKVIFEHLVLTTLSQLQPQPDFQLPTPITTINKQTFQDLSNSNTHCALFHLIPGSLPKLSYVYEIGKASGTLSTLLARIQHVQDKMKPPTPPYWELYNAHPSVGGSRQVFMDFIAGPDFKETRDSMNFLKSQMEDMEARIHKLQSLNLPLQLIHGDLHYDNVLCHKGKVSAILDFEFTALDWRCMELAICLSKYAGEPEPMKYFIPFIKGYLDSGVELNTLERENVGPLIVLRILSNVVFFVGRAIAGEDTVETLNVRLGTYARRVKWIWENDADIRQLLNV
ncbi:hypothetical protein HDV05_003188 [Chytridiales sp. JEL 0842]|nr:hypothetical protein HDV05_003188 [Chytridiales sp. JEL 0842]